MGKFEITLDQVPISKETLDGAHLNNNDIHILCRTLSMWGLAYEEQFEEQGELLKEICDEVKELRKEVNEIKVQVKCTQEEVADIREDVERLKKLNSFSSILIRIGIGVAIALGLFRLIHGKF